MTAEDIKEMRDNGLCVVVAEDPAAIKFLDPIPSAMDRTKQEAAAIALSRKIMSPGFWDNSDTRKSMTAHFVDLLVAGTSLDPKPTKEEAEKKIFSDEKAEEIRKIAREEARSERSAAKAQAAATLKK